MVNKKKAFVNPEYIFIKERFFDFFIVNGKSRNKK
jgi:hypothetical protein